MSTNQKKILMIEDNDDHRHVLKVALEHEGYVVRMAEGAHQGLHYADEFKPDVILLDIALMGYVDGWEVLRRLRAKQDTASIPIMIISALNSPEDEDTPAEAKLSGAEDYLMKPFELNELFMRVRRILLAREDAAPEDVAAA